jgi:hypothetical protein
MMKAIAVAEPGNNRNHLTKYNAFIITSAELIEYCFYENGKMHKLGSIPHGVCGAA